MSNVQIGLRIRELRKARNYTREDLANMVDISSKFLYEIETGKKGFSAETLSKLSDALQVSCDYIMLGKEQYNIGKIVYILKMLEPEQIDRMQNILQIICEMCDIISFEKSLKNL